MSFIQAGPGKSRSAVRESLADPLHVWEVLLWLLGQPLTSLPTRRFPQKGPRSPWDTVPQGCAHCPGCSWLPKAGSCPRGQAGLCRTRVWLSPITDNQGEEGGKT